MASDKAHFRKPPGPDDFPVLAYKPRGFAVGFTIKDFAALSAADGYTRELLAHYGRMMAESPILELARRLACHCAAGHEHDTYQGRLLCDAMEDDS